MADIVLPVQARTRFSVPPFIRDFTRKIILRSYLLGLGASVLLGGSYLAFGQGTTATQAQSTSVASVERRTIVSSVKATGKVTFANEQTLKFNQKGTVAKVNVKEGDHVKQGQVIAELDKSSVIADVQSAQLSVSASALQLQQLKNDKQKSILDAQNALDDAQRQFTQAQNALSVSKEKLPTEIAAAQRTVTEKVAAVTQAQAALEQAKITTLQDLGSTAQTILTKSEETLDSLYSILVNDSSARASTSSPTLDIYYRLYNDYSLKNETQNKYFAALQAVEGMRSKYGNSLPTLTDAGALAEAVSDAKSAATALNTLTDSMYRMVQGAIEDSNDFTINDINAIKQNITSARTSTTSLISDAQTAQASLVGGEDHLTSIIIQQKTDAVTSAQNALTDAKENLDILQTQNPADLQKLADSIEQMKANLASKKAALDSTTTSTDVNIKLKQNDVAQKSTSVAKAAKTLQDYQLTAPFDGIVTHLDYKKGDNLLDTGDTESLSLQNPDFIIVTIPLDQVDIVRVHKDLKATILLDALPGQTFDGTIDTIDSTPITTSGVVSYNVLIKLPTPKDLTILSGMTATVNVETTRKENVLVVPNLALRTQGNTVTVQKADGTTAVVTKGVTDGQYTEILSGLNQGDSVLSVNVAAASGGSSTNANSAQQLFRLGGGATGAGNFTGGGTRRAQ